MGGSANPQRLPGDERAAWQQENKRVRDREREVRRKEEALAGSRRLMTGGRYARLEQPWAA